MTCVVRSVAVFLLGSLLAVCQEAPPQRNASVSGIVVATDSGQPLAKARVVLYPSGREGRGHSGSTAPDGTFSFPDVAPGTYVVQVERNGFVPQRGASNISLTVRAGSDVGGLRLKLAPAAVITGKVVNEDEEPVLYANVEALRRRYGPGGPTLIAAGSASTNDLGEYRIFGLPPDRYILRVTPQGRGNVISRLEPETKGPEADTSIPPVYYPDTTNRDAALPFEVRAGFEARADFRLTRVTGGAVRGHVTGMPKSEPPIHATVSLRSDRMPVAGTQVREDGSFELRGVAPGTYSLDAYCAEPNTPPGREPNMRSAHRKVVVASGQAEEVSLNLQPVPIGEIRGQIRAEGSVPKLDQLYVSFNPVRSDPDEGGPMFTGARAGSVKADGSFTVQMRGRGKYRAALYARGPGLEDYYTKAVYYGGRDVTDSGFSYTGSAALLEVVVSSAGARIEGSVVDDQGKPVPGATVVTVPEKDLRDDVDLYQRARSDQLGNFVIRGQRPGTYTVFAWDDIRDPVYLDPAFLKEYENSGRSLRAEANGRHQLTLKVLPVHLPE